jgi:hypothetical protein
MNWELGSANKIFNNNFLVKTLLIVVLFISFLFILKPLTYDYYPDFSAYYYAAKTLLSGGNPYIDLGKGFGIFLYPPPTLLFFLPFSILSFPLAGKIFTAFSILSLLASVYLLLRIIKVKPFSNLGIFLLILTFNFFPAKFTLGMGQINNFVLLATVLFIYFYYRKNWNLAGAFLAVSTLLKISPAILLFVPLVQKNKKVLKAFTGGTLIILLMSYLLFNNVAGDYYNQSLAGFLIRELKDPYLFGITRTLTVILFLSLTLFVISKFKQRKRNLYHLSPFAENLGREPGDEYGEFSASEGFCSRRSEGRRGPERVLAGASSATISPSLISMVLLAPLAISGSCVTRTIVLPFLFRFDKNSIISLPDLLSRFPVGSSANIKVGLLIRALAIATLCCCPPES